MNVYGAMVEWYWQENSEVLKEKYKVWVVGRRMYMDEWWNDTEKGILKYWEKNITQSGR